MKYTTENMSEVLESKNFSDREKIDELLEMDAKIYCNLGTDSTKGDIELAKKNSRKIYSLIKKIDSVMGDSFLKLMDKKQ
jgi:hypothetical protein